MSVEHSIQGDKSIRGEVALWALFSLVVRVAFLFATPRVIDSADSILYLDAAQKIAAGMYAEVNPRIPLLYPALSALASSIGPDVEAASLLVSLVAGTLLIVPVFALSRRLHGISAARFVALIIAVWPWLVDYSCRVAPETLYISFWFWSLLALLNTIRGGIVSARILPFPIIALYLARPEGIVVASALLIAGLVAGKGAGLPLRRLVPTVVLLLAVIPIHAWILHKLSAATGVPPRFSEASLQFSLGTRGGETLRTAVHLLVITIPVMLGPLFALALIGIAGRTEPRDRRGELVVATVAFAQFVAAALSTYAEPRYVMATIVVIALWSGRGAAALMEYAGRWQRWRPLRFAPAILILGMMLAGLARNIVPPLMGHMSYKPLEYKIAGDWMHANLEPGLILSRKPQIGYYAHMPTSGPAPDDSMDDVHQRIIDGGMRYVVVDERYSTQMAPALKPLLDPKNAPPWLRVMNANLSPYPDARIVIYEVVADMHSR